MLYLVHFSYNTELSSDYFVFEENNYYLCPRNTVLQTSQGVLSKSENAFYVCTKRGSREITALFSWKENETIGVATATSFFFLVL